MKWSEMESKLNELGELVLEAIAPDIEATARIEKGGVIKEKLADLKNDYAEADKEHKDVIDKYYAVVRSPGSQEPPKPEQEEEEPPKTLDEFTERFVNQLGDTK